MPNVSEIVSVPNIIRERWLTPEVAIQRVVDFERLGEYHLDLACHAALPSILTPELVNLIRINFLDKKTPWVADVDFLLSRLCYSRGEGMFEVEPRVREVLLVELKNTHPWNDVLNLAKFLRVYVGNKTAKLPLDVRLTYSRISDAYLRPDTVIQEARDYLNRNLFSSDEDQLTKLTDQIQIIDTLELLKGPLERSHHKSEVDELFMSTRVLAYYLYGNGQQLRGDLQRHARSSERSVNEATSLFSSVIDWIVNVDISLKEADLVDDGELFEELIESTYEANDVQAQDKSVFSSDQFPRIWSMPFQRNPYFTGRETVLQNLHEALSRDSATALTQGYAIFGLGGIGKTQTALEYIYRYRSEYRFIFWIRADTDVALQAGFVEMAKLLGLPEKDATNPAETVQAVKHWLEREGEWLLIFDNADTPEMLKAYYPRQPRGHILLTSRAQLFDTLGITRPLALEKMQPEEALSFLYTRTGRAESDLEEKKTAAQLAAELGYLPLALEQAAAYITAKTARFQDYLASYQRQRLALLNKAQPRTGEYPESVAKTWALNFQEVEKDPVAADILRVSAFLSPDAIPLELLSSGASQLGPVLAGALAASEDPLALNEALEPLTRYSLIRLDVDAQTYSIHRMVQEVVKDQVGGARQAQWAERVVRAVAQSFPEVDYQTWTRCERYIPHVLLCAAQIDRWSMTFPEARNLLFQAGKYFYQRGLFWEAEPLLKSVLAMCERVLGPEHPETLGSLNNLANLYKNQGKYEQAEPLYQRVLEASERVLGPEHPDTLGSLNNLALLYASQGKYEQAEPLFQRALETRERVLGPEHPNTLNTVNNLAILYTNQGKYEQAEPLFQRVLALRERVLGPEHPDTLSSLNNLANLYKNKGKYEQAESLFQRALTTRERVLGPEHPDTLSTVNNLALLYADQGKYEQAELLYHQALTTYERVLGPEHPDTIRVRNNYADFLEMKQKTKAVRAKPKAPRKQGRK